MPPSGELPEMSSEAYESDLVDIVDSEADTDYTSGHCSTSRKTKAGNKGKLKSSASNRSSKKPKKTTTARTPRSEFVRASSVSSVLSTASSGSATGSNPTEEATTSVGPDASLEELLKKEEELQLKIDSLIEQIKKLEGGSNPEADEPDDEELDYSNFDAPEWCVPIKANVMTFEWSKLAEACQFDVILMDPPWQLASHAPTRGVAIAYQQLPDPCIEELPIQTLQQNGFIFIWVINNKYVKAFELMERWGYTYVDDITWVKQTVNRRMAKGHGYYLQHAKETCLVGRKGNDPPGCRHGISSDVIFSERRGQSQKPEELYQMIEKLVPNGKYLEIFGRKNNLRDFWVTVGNEL